MPVRSVIFFSQCDILHQWSCTIMEEGLSLRLALRLWCGFCQITLTSCLRISSIRVTLPFNVVQLAIDNFCVPFLPWPNIVSVGCRYVIYHSSIHTHTSVQAFDSNHNCNATNFIKTLLNPVNPNRYSNKVFEVHWVPAYIELAYLSTAVLLSNNYSQLTAN